MRVKGKNEPVPIFEPIGLDDELDDMMRAELDQWHAALEAVRRRQWGDAEQALRTCRLRHPQDGLYSLYLERVAHYRVNPPGADWDGVTSVETK